MQEGAPLHVHRCPVTCSLHLATPHTHISPFYHRLRPDEELRCVLAIIRHGDRTPKQKMKMKVTQVRGSE